MPRELDLLTCITIIPPKQYVTVRIHWAGSLGIGSSNVAVHAGCVERMMGMLVMVGSYELYHRTWWQRVLDWAAGSGHHCHHCDIRPQDQWS